MGHPSFTGHSFHGKPRPQDYSRRKPHEAAGIRVIRLRGYGVSPRKAICETVSCPKSRAIRIFEQLARCIFQDKLTGEKKGALIYMH